VGIEVESVTWSENVMNREVRSWSWSGNRSIGNRVGVT